MIDFDVTWNYPTEPQLAALDFAYRALGIRRPEPKLPFDHHFLVTYQALGRSLAVDVGILSGAVFRLNEYDYAELITLASKSLWYTQAKQWAEHPPENVPETWRDACVFIVNVVDLGYDAESKKWWDLGKLDERYVESGRLLLLDFKYMLTQYRRNRMDIVSRGFEAFIDLICDKPWISRFRKKLRDNMPYQAAKCIKPDCPNLVAPAGKEPQEGHFKNYRGTGACQKGHNSYQCPQCKAPHSYASGIGKKHLENAQASQ